MQLLTKHAIFEINSVQFCALMRTITDSSFCYDAVPDSELEMRLSCLIRSVRQGKLWRLQVRPFLRLRAGQHVVQLSSKGTIAPLALRNLPE